MKLYTIKHLVNKNNHHTDYKLFKNLRQMINSSSTLIKFFHKLSLSLHFMYNCSLKSDSNNPNTHTDIKNLTVGQEVSEIVSNHISNQCNESSGQKTESLENNQLLDIDVSKSQAAIIQWINTIYSPTHFLTIRLPLHLESNDKNISLNHLRFVMKLFEKNLLGKRWFKKHLPFIAFAELGHGINWHYHILFNQQNFTDDVLKVALDQVTQNMELSDYNLNLQRIDDHICSVSNYCIKELKIDIYGKFDGDRMILSSELFNLEKQIPITSKVANGN